MAKTENIKKSAEEKVKIAVMGSYEINGKINLNELNKNLRQVEGLTDILYNNTTIINDNKIEKLPIEVVVDGYTFTIDENGKVTRKAPKPKVTHTTNPSQEIQVEEGEKIAIIIKATTTEGTISKITDPERKRNY